MRTSDCHLFVLGYDLDMLVCVLRVASCWILSLEVKLDNKILCCGSVGRFTFLVSTFVHILCTNLHQARYRIPQQNLLLQYIEPFQVQQSVRNFGKMGSLYEPFIYLSKSIIDPLFFLPWRFTNLSFLPKHSLFHPSRIQVYCLSFLKHIIVYFGYLI